VADILEELPPLRTSGTANVALSNGHAGNDASASEDPLLEALGFEPVSLDALSARTGWSAAALQARMLELELDGHISRLPGGLFQRTASA
jgi:DNA processing protein